MRHRVPARIFVLVSLLAVTPVLQAQTASLVADLSPEAGPSGLSSLPSSLFSSRGRVFFSATEPSSGRELWATDGQDQGTHLLADFCPGPCDSYPHIFGDTARATVGLLRSGRHFLWRSDATRPGTYLLPSPEDPVDVEEDFYFEDDGAVVFLNKVFYFPGCNSEEGCGLWRSDGTPAGTRLVKTLESFRGGLAAVGNRLFFFDGPALWVTDGTTGGTRKVRDLPSNARLPTELGSRVVFISDEELWTSDGTAAGTRALTSFVAERPFQQTRFFKLLGGRLYFVVDDVVHGAEIWTTDGSPAGTRPVTAIGFHDPFLWDSSDPYQSGLQEAELDILGNRIVFWATDGIHGFQPWSTTGTPASMAPLCSTCSFENRQAPLVRSGSRLLFIGLDAQHGAETWATDGTAQGTALVEDVCPGSCSGAASKLMPLLGQAFFGGFDGRERALWTSDGTAARTRRFAVPAPYWDSFSEPETAALGSTVVYAGTGPTDDYGVELWASSGTPAGTRLVTDVSRGGSSSGLRGLTAAGRNLYFDTCNTDSTRRIWHTEGTAESTRPADSTVFCGSDQTRSATVGGALLFLVQEHSQARARLWRRDPGGTATQLLELPEGLYIADSATLGGQLFLMAAPLEEPSLPLQIWRSDGTVQGTGKVADLPAGLRSPSYATTLGTEIWFLVSDVSQRDGSEIWRTDGTQAGTRKAADLGESRTVTNPDFTRVGSNVFFAAFDEQGPQLWKTDGTAAGAMKVRQFVEDLPADLTAFQGALYFSARTAQGGVGLWRTDGTPQGTLLVKEVPVSRTDDGYFPATLDLAAAGSWLVFQANDGIHERALWRSDGTAAGTALLRRLRLADPIGLSTSDRLFQPAAGRLYFTADDGVHGYELWQTDGTAAGTRLVQDIAPEGASSSPDNLTVAEDRLFFLADDGASGQELWVLPFTGPRCRPSASALCLAGGRFEVKVSWRDFTGGTGSGHAVPLSGDTGYFWFFDPANVETMVKVLDGSGANGHFWVFFGALSNVEYTLTVTDTQTGLTRRYFNPKGVFASVGDTQGFGPLGAYGTETRTAAGALPRIAGRTEAAAATGVCVPGAGRLCLNAGRFAVEASWKDFSGRTGNGTAVVVTGDTGYFWFFDSANVEAVVKVLDGTPLNGHFWVFYGALSNVEYRLTVTDTVTGAVKVYNNPRGRFASVGDTGAF
jgi:ELWxxDGT repeat protein